MSSILLVDYVSSLRFYPPVCYHIFLAYYVVCLVSLLVILCVRLYFCPVFLHLSWYLDFLACQIVILYFFAYLNVVVSFLPQPASHLLNYLLLFSHLFVILSDLLSAFHLTYKYISHCLSNYNFHLPCMSIFYFIFSSLPVYVLDCCIRSSEFVISFYYIVPLTYLTSR